jgi:hypothetical protein
MRYIPDDNFVIAPVSVSVPSKESFRQLVQTIFRISGSPTGGYEDLCLLWYNVVGWTTQRYIPENITLDYILYWKLVVS